MKKRVLSIALVLTLVFGLFTAFNASAAVDSQPESDSEEIKNMGEGLHFFDFEEQGRVKDTANQPQNVQYLNDSEDVGPIFITDKDDIFYGGCKLTSLLSNGDENGVYHINWTVAGAESSDYSERIKSQISKALSYANAPYASGLLELKIRLNQAKEGRFELVDGKETLVSGTGENCDVGVCVEIECFDESKSIKKQSYIQNSWHNSNVYSTVYLDVSNITADDISAIRFLIMYKDLSEQNSETSDIFNFDIDISSIYIPYISKLFKFFNLSNGTLSISDYYGYIDRLTIPNKIDGKNVTVIDKYAFSNLDKLHRMKSVTIPDTVVSIQEGAFFACRTLGDITIPDSVKFIGPDAFLDTAVYNKQENWEDNVLYIGNNLISGSKTSFNVHNYTFNLLSTAEGDYTVKQGTRLIAGDAFVECKKLDSITIPPSVKYIGSHAVGFRYSEKWEKYILKTDFMIYCYKNTAAENYAKKNSIKYTLLEGEFGDVNGDNIIDMRDALQIRKHVAKQPVALDINLADVTCDGAVDMIDVMQIRKYIAKQPVTLGPQG